MRHIATCSARLKCATDRVIAAKAILLAGQCVQPTWPPATKINRPVPGPMFYVNILHGHKKKMLFDSPKKYFRYWTLCLSCKACKSECPSNIDMARFKAEFLQQYYGRHGFPNAFALLVGWSAPELINIGMIFRPITNQITATQSFQKNQLVLRQKRRIPELSKLSLRQWYKKPVLH